MYKVTSIRNIINPFVDVTYKYIFASSNGHVYGSNSEPVAGDYFWTGVGVDWLALVEYEGDWKESITYNWRECV